MAPRMFGLAHLKLGGLLAGAVLALAGCSGGSWITNGPEQAMNPTNQHPILVDSEVSALPVQGESEFDPATLAGLDEFVDGYLARGRGMLDIGVQAGADQQAQLMSQAEAIADYAHARGVASSALKVHALEQGGEAGIVIKYERYVVRPPVCPDFSRSPEFNPRNTPTSNFGCASQRDLALMTGNPAHLVTAAEFDRRDAQRTGLAVRAYRAGESASSKYDLNTSSFTN